MCSHSRNNVCKQSLLRLLSSSVRNQLVSICLARKTRVFEFCHKYVHKCVKKKIIKQINPYLVNSTVDKNKSYRKWWSCNCFYWFNLKYLEYINYDFGEPKYMRKKKIGKKSIFETKHIFLLNKETEVNFRYRKQIREKEFYLKTIFCATWRIEQVPVRYNASNALI